LDLDGRDLYEEMSRDRIVIDYLKDRSIATDFYGAMCNVDWYPKRPPVPEDELIIQRLRGERDEYWSCSWRTAGGYIAEIRNMNHGTKEDYMDYYCAGNEGQVTDLVRECFDRMGWIPETFY
jgi:hypothetical protein